MIILAIDTSCDDTSAAVLMDDRILANVVSSQVDLHKDWGGVVPDIAMRAHKERIEAVIAEAIKRSQISDLRFQKHIKKDEKIKEIIAKGMEKIEVIAVTKGSGLAPALSVGVNKAKELAIEFDKKLVAVNHIEGHILSVLAKNRAGRPERQIEWPALALTISGGHTKIVRISGIGKYEVVGETLDDAAGEALDKAAKQMGLGYPGGPVIERLAESGNDNFMELPRPLKDRKDFDYSFSGLKTAFYYQIKKLTNEEINEHLTDYAASYQRAVFETLLMKYGKAIDEYKVKSLIAVGGVMANQKLRKMLGKLARDKKIPIYFPVKKILNTDNAGMIGLVGYFQALRGEFVENKAELDRDPRMEIGN